MFLIFSVVAFGAKHGNSPVKSVGLVFRLINLVYACYLRAGGEGMQGTTHTMFSAKFM